MTYICGYVHIIIMCCNSPDVFNVLYLTTYTKHSYMYQDSYIFMMTFIWYVHSIHMFCKIPDVFIMIYICLYVQRIVKCCNTPDIFVLNYIWRYVQSIMFWQRTDIFVITYIWRYIQSLIKFSKRTDLYLTVCTKRILVFHMGRCFCNDVYLKCTKYN